MESIAKDVSLRGREHCNIIQISRVFTKLAPCKLSWILSDRQGFSLADALIWQPMPDNNPEWTLLTTDDKLRVCQPLCIFHQGLETSLYKFPPNPLQ